MKNKYNNKKVEIEGIKFDSRDEAQYYLMLKKQMDLGEVLNIELQPKFELQSKFSKYGKNYKAITYTPDFAVTYKCGKVEYIDIKGMSTQQGDMRRKMFDYKYPYLTLKWISKSIKFGVDGWIDYDELKTIRRKNNNYKKHKIAQEMEELSK